MRLVLKTWKEYEVPVVGNKNKDRSRKIGRIKATASPDWSQPPSYHHCPVDQGAFLGASLWGGPQLVEILLQLILQGPVEMSLKEINRRKTGRSSRRNAHLRLSQSGKVASLPS